jgi:hypothetical protein
MPGWVLLMKQVGMRYRIVQAVACGWAVLSASNQVAIGKLDDSWAMRLGGNNNITILYFILRFRSARSQEREALLVAAYGRHVRAGTGFGFAVRAVGRGRRKSSRRTTSFGPADVFVGIICGRTRQKRSLVANGFG